MRKSYYLVMVRSQLLDHMMQVRHTIGDQAIPVKASSEEAASRAAVAWMGDSHPVYHLDDHPNEDGVFLPCEERKNPEITLPETCGHAIFWESLRLRHTSFRVTLITQGELDEFFSITCGLSNGTLVQA